MLLYSPAWWSTRNPVSVLLWPLSLLYRGVITLRRIAYQRGWLKSQRVSVPVLVIGNLSVGGNGKTPLVLWIAQLLLSQGYLPGILCRGYGGRSKARPRIVFPDSDPNEVGDEAVLLAQRSGCPVVAGVDRVAGAHLLTAQKRCTVILCDDGLQHYRLQRDIEIVVVDPLQKGNGLLLPAGPLREPYQRLQQVDFILWHGVPDPDTPVHRHLYTMTLQPVSALNLQDPQVRCDLTFFRDQTVHAIAGIGRPARFFAMLRAYGLRIVEHPFADHHRFTHRDLAFADHELLLMTEKDAVKCRAFARPTWWFIPIHLQINGLERPLLERLRRVQAAMD